MAIVQDQGELIVNGSLSTTDIDEEMVRASTSGVEIVQCYGVFGGAKVEIQSEVRFLDGTSSGFVTIPDGDYTENFAESVLAGLGNNIHLKVTGITALTNIMAKVTPIL